MQASSAVCDPGSAAGDSAAEQSSRGAVGDAFDCC